MVLIWIFKQALKLALETNEMPLCKPTIAYISVDFKKPEKYRRAFLDSALSLHISFSNINHRFGYISLGSNFESKRAQYARLSYIINLMKVRESFNRKSKILKMLSKKSLVNNLGLFAS